MRFFEKDKDTVVIKFFATIDYWFNNANQFTALFESLDARYKNIIIEAHCYGGHVFEGNVMYNSILNAKADVTIDIVGVSASMFSIVMLAGKKLRIADNAFIMIHTPSGFTDGNAAQHESAAKLLRKMEANFIKRYSEKTGKPVSEVKAWFDGTDHWFTAEEALEMGMADEIIPAVLKMSKT